MTLVITDVSHAGIVMVADSALTTVTTLPSGRRSPRILTGTQKLFFSPDSRIGASIWGAAELDVDNWHGDASVWIEEFVQAHRDVGDVGRLATILAETLNASGKNGEPFGVHLAGYGELEGRKGSMVFHVRNITYSDRHPFQPGLTLRPNDYGTVANGDYGPFVLIYEQAARSFHDVLARTGKEFPPPSLQGRVQYFMAWVRFLSELYASAEVPQVIGGPVWGIGFNRDQTIEYLRPGMSG